MINDHFGNKAYGMEPSFRVLHELKRSNTRLDYLLLLYCYNLVFECFISQT